MSKKQKELPSQEYLKECFDYDFKTGVLTWRERPLNHFATNNAAKVINSRSVGKAAGSLIKSNGKSYYSVSICGIGYGLHRVIWKWVTGENPTECIDHIDGDGLNNSFGNLRDATFAENLRNTKKCKRNTTGFKGVLLSSDRKKFISQIKVSGKSMHLGTFDSTEQAAIAYQQAAKKHFGSFANFG